MAEPGPRREPGPLVLGRARRQPNGVAPSARQKDLTK
jgi:hypothetical protein